MRLSRDLSRMLLLRGATLLHDTFMGAAAFFLSLVLRLDLPLVKADLGAYCLATAMFGVVVGTVGFVLGMNRGVWRYASLPDLLAILKTATISVTLFIAAHFFLVRLEAIPRSTLIISWAFLVVLLAAPRAIYRIYRNHRDTRRVWKQTGIPVKRVILIGAGDNAEMFLKLIAERSSVPYKVLAIIDERGRRVGRFIRGVPILGPLDRLPQIVQRFSEHGQRPDAIILTRGREDYEVHAPLERLIETVAEQRLEMLRLPDMFEMKDVGDFELRPIRLEDLLQRKPVQLDQEKIERLITARKVLITGAGGSIGSELARQIARLSPASLMLLDASEYLLYSIDHDIGREFPDLKRQAILCNVREAEAVTRLMEEIRPDIVFHAAALKHVPMVEVQPLEGLHTNAIGTRNVAEAAIRSKVSAMVMVSTDKAVNPANVMGASKRLAEMFCQAMDLNAEETGTRFVTVRFGNVLGSAGSVVPLFEKQLKTGGPLTVTHPDIERYFMTIPEACLLVLKAAGHSLTRAEHRGRIFVLDMGTPVKIADLARNLIRLSGLRPGVDVKIAYTGLRPGEKLYEELFDTHETLAEADADGIRVAFPRPIERVLVARIFDEMRKLIEAGDVGAALRLLKATVTEFVPGEEVRQMLEMHPGSASVNPIAFLRETEGRGPA